MAKQSGTLNLEFGGYSLTDPKSGSLQRFAEDITLTVQTLLRAAGGADLDNGMEDGLKAAGDLLTWARECFKIHGCPAHETDGRDE